MAARSNRRAHTWWGRGTVGGPGQGPAQPWYQCQDEGWPRLSCWGLPVYAWLQGCVPSALWASGIIYLECPTSYISRIKVVLSFPVEKQSHTIVRASPLHWALNESSPSKQALENPRLGDQTLPSAIWVTLLHCMLPTWPLSSFNCQFVCVPLLSCWDEFAAGVSEEGRSNNLSLFREEKWSGLWSSDLVPSHPLSSKWPSRLTP